MATFLSELNRPQSLRATLIRLGIFLCLLFLLLVTVFHWQTRQYAIDQHAERLDDFLAQHKAMHQYIENQQKPAQPA